MKNQTAESAGLSRGVEDQLTPSNLQSLDRAIMLLRATAHSESGMRLTDLAKTGGLSKSTTHRILSSLVSHGLLQLSTQNRMYTPGIDLYQLGLAAARHFSLIDVARPALQRLADLTEDTVYLSVIDGPEAMCADRIIGAYPIKTLTLAPGDRRPLGVGAGALALLAALNDKDMLAVVNDESRRSPNYQQFTAAVLKRLVNETRRKDYSYNHERVFKGMSAVGVVIPGFNGQPIGAVSVAAISSRMSTARRFSIVEQLKKESQAISKLASRHTGEPF